MPVHEASIKKACDRDREFPVHVTGMVFTVQLTGNYQFQVQGNKNLVMSTAFPCQPTVMGDIETLSTAKDCNENVPVYRNGC